MYSDGHVRVDSPGIRPLVLLLDADISLAPGVIAAARERLLSEHLDLLSVMATLRMQSAWEKLLIPPFIYFFKLIYPFALSQQANSRVAAAAGGAYRFYDVCRGHDEFLA